MADKLFYTVIITSILIAIIIIFFVISIIRYHDHYIQLQRDKIQNQILIQEEERKRIANDLHDSLGPMLSTVKLYMHNISVNNDADKESLDKASVYIDDTISNLREISYNLLPSSLSRNDLRMVVKEYISRISGRSELQIDLEISDELTIPKKIELHLFRIIQEIIQNTLKHSRAKNLKLVLTNEQNTMLLMSADDGVGFNLDKTLASAGGLGLKSIENRCEMLNASLKFITSNNKGCKIIIKVPNNI
jgi:signal transduction histidine kinase